MTRASPPLVYIILLNWNGWRDTLECLDSLRNLTYPNWRVVVVDNASTDGSEAKIRDACPGIELLQSGSNRGFAHGNNLGIDYALRRSADYVWLLNNDTIVAPEALTYLVLRAESAAAIGFVGSKILYASDPTRVWAAGGEVVPYNGAARNAWGGDRDDEHLPGMHEPDYVSGCSVLVHTDVVREIGGLPEDYFLYYEEVDWEFSGRAHGWRIVYEPASVILHKVSVSAGIDSPLAVYHASRSRAIFVRKHLPKAAFRSAVSTVRNNTWHQWKHGRWRQGIAGLQGLFAGLTYKPRHEGAQVAQHIYNDVPASGRIRH